MFEILIFTKKISWEFSICALGGYINEFSKGFTLQLHELPKQIVVDSKDSKQESKATSEEKWEYQYKLEGEWDLDSKLIMYGSLNKWLMNTVNYSFASLLHFYCAYLIFLVL